MTLSLTINWRDADEATGIFDGVINCTGADFDIGSAGQRPLMTNLLRDGLATRGLAGFGISADLAGAVVDASETPNTRLSAIGPLLRGTYWESNAVPEIVPQTFEIARRLVGGRHRDEPAIARKKRDRIKTSRSEPGLSQPCLFDHHVSNQNMPS